jgi:hypothetical protein
MIPLIAIGIVLVEHMVPAIRVKSTVGIIDPPRFRKEVIDRAMRVSGGYCHLTLHPRSRTLKSGSIVVQLGSSP